MNNNININLYIESISNVAKILLQEASHYNQKFNNEYFENAFADFDFNSDDKIKRKLSNEEFKFLTKYLFQFLSVIILTYESHLEQFDYESDEMRELYWKIFDTELNGFSYSLKEKKEIKCIYQQDSIISYILKLSTLILFLFFVSPSIQSPSQHRSINIQRMPGAKLPEQPCPGILFLVANSVRHGLVMTGQQVANT